MDTEMSESDIRHLYSTAGRQTHLFPPCWVGEADVPKLDVTLQTVVGYHLTTL